MGSFFKTAISSGLTAAFNEKQQEKIRQQATYDAATAAHEGNFAVAIDLIRTKGGDPNYVTSYRTPEEGWYAINVGIDAIRRNDQQALTDLLALGLKPNLADYERNSLLHVAISLKNETAANILIDSGASVTYDGGGPLALAPETRTTIRIRGCGAEN